MNLLERIRRPSTPRRSDPFLSIDDYLSMFSYDGNLYPYGLGNQSWSKTEEKVTGGYAGLAASALKRNPIVWSVNLKRQQLFTELRYGFRRIRNGRPAGMFSSAALLPLEEPEPGQNTAGMNARLIQDVDLAGNAYRVRRVETLLGGRQVTRLRRPRPDWCKLLLGSQKEVTLVDGDDPSDLDLDPIALAYYPTGNFEDQDSVQIYDYKDVAHWAPYPDPDNRWLGMSWLTPVLREVAGDNAATTHKRRYWENAATPNLMIKLDIDEMVAFKEWVDAFNDQHQGAANAYKTLFLGAGADPTIIGGNMQQMDFANIAGVSENRIVIAGGLTATLLGTTEGLKGSSLNAGNYNSSRRSTADTTYANLIRTACGALGKVVDVPSDAELWIFKDDIPFLQEDEQDAANIRSRDALTIESLIRGGFLPESAVAAVTSGDFSVLEHTGLVSVQLQPPGADDGGGMLDDVQ